MVNNGFKKNRRKFNRKRMKFKKSNKQKNYHLYYTKQKIQ